MKIIYSIIIGLALLSTNVSSGQETSDKELLLGEWIFEFEKSFSEISSASRAHLKNISDQELEVIQNNYKNRRIYFDSNGQFRQIQQNGAELNGVWQFDSSKKLLTISFPNGAIFIQKVGRVNHKSLLLMPNTEGNISVLIENQYFTKK